MGSVFCSYIIDNRFTRLRNAIDDSNEKQLREFFTKHKDLIDCQIDKYGNTPLIYAVQQAKLDSCRVLLELGANPNKANELTMVTPLHAACTLKTLKSNSSVYNVNHEQLSTSMNALHVLSISQLLSTLTNQNNENKQQNSITKKDSSDSTTTNSSNDSTNVLITNTETISDIINVLVARGADINKVINTEKMDDNSITTTKLTPLMLAIERRNMTAIEALIAAGADINYQDHNSHICALHLACGIGNVYLINKLLEHGANPYLKSKGGNSALHWLALNYKDEISGLLTVLHYTNYLINVNLANDCGQTPLMLAAMKNKQNMVNQLLENDALTEITDNKGLTVMDYAKDPSCLHMLTSFEHVRYMRAKKLSQSQLSLNISDSRNNLSKSITSLANLSIAPETTLAAIEEDFTKSVLDEKKINQETLRN